ncbi:MAG: transferase [Pusillimonas sp.]|jgi:glycosyltransferase involved in cell wall biosynthesis|nr:transferase [Pusillimonas sp.]
MKILYTNIHHGNGGGHVTYIMNLLRNLKDGHDLWLGTPSESRLFRYARDLRGVNVQDMRFTSRPATLLREVRALRRFLRRENFDLVHVNASADHRHFMLARMGLPNPPKLVWTRHNDRRINSFGHHLRARFGTDHVIAVSDYVAQGLATSPYRALPSTTIRHGIDTQYYTPVNEARRVALRQRWFGDKHENLIVMGSVGGTDTEKGWLDLVEAVAMLPESQRARFRLLVAGDPPDETRVNRVIAAGMLDACVFPGLVDDIRDVLGACDAGFVLSHFEALSYACRETMAMGLPTLVTNAGGLPENLVHGQQGWVVPVRKPDAIVPVLLSMLENPRQLSEMGLAARQHSEQHFGLGPFAAQTLQVYKNTVASI